MLTIILGFEDFRSFWPPTVLTSPHAPLRGVRSLTIEPRKALPPIADAFTPRRDANIVICTCFLRGKAQNYRLAGTLHRKKIVFSRVSAVDKTSNRTNFASKNRVAQNLIVPNRQSRFKATTGVETRQERYDAKIPQRKSGFPA